MIAKSSTDGVASEREVGITIGGGERVHFDRQMRRVVAWLGLRWWRALAKARDLPKVEARNAHSWISSQYS